MARFGWRGRSVQAVGRRAGRPPAGPLRAPVNTPATLSEPLEPRLLFAVGSVDVVVSNAVLHLVPNPRSAPMGNAPSSHTRSPPRA